MTISNSAPVIPNAETFGKLLGNRYEGDLLHDCRWCLCNEYGAVMRIEASVYTCQRCHRQGLVGVGLMRATCKNYDGYRKSSGWFKEFLGSVMDSLAINHLVTQIESHALTRNPDPTLKTPTGKSKQAIAITTSQSPAKRPASVEEIRSKAVSLAREARLGQALEQADYRDGDYRVTRGRAMSCVLMPAAWMRETEKSLRREEGAPVRSHALYGLRVGTHLMFRVWNGRMEPFDAKKNMTKLFGYVAQTTSKAVAWLKLQNVRQLRAIPAISHDRAVWHGVPYPRTSNELRDGTFFPVPYGVVADLSLRTLDVFTLFKIHEEAEIRLERYIADRVAERLEEGLEADAYSLDPRNNRKFRGKILPLATGRAWLLRELQELFEGLAAPKTLKASLRRLSSAGFINFDEQKNKVYLTPGALRTDRKTRGSTSYRASRTG